MSLAKQRHLVALRKNVKEKVENIIDQQHLLTTILDEYVSDTKMRADFLLGIEDFGHFMQNYVDVMQSLDRCYNTCVLLTAEAENCIEDAERPSSPSSDKAVATENEVQTTEEGAVGVTVVLPEVCSKMDLTASSVTAVQPKVCSKSDLTALSSMTSVQPEVCRKTDFAASRMTSVQPEMSSRIDFTASSMTNLLPEVCSKRDITAASVTVGQYDEYSNSDLEADKVTTVQHDGYSNLNLGATGVNLAESSSKPVTEKLMPNVTRTIELAAEEKESKEVRNTWKEQDQRNKDRRPKINTGVAKRFLAGVLKQAEADNLKSSKPQKGQNASKHEAAESRSQSIRGQRSHTPDNFLESKQKIQQVAMVPVDEEPAAIPRKVVQESVCKMQDSVNLNVKQKHTEDKDGYGFGPDLKAATLSVEQPVTVVITEPSSPWQFFVQQVMSGLDNLMEQIFSYMLKKGEDKGLISQPIEGMICLAKYSLDNVYYRAKVTKVYSMESNSGDIAVDVLFVDYGNCERRSSSHLRELPPQFTKMPTQAIACALAKVSPTNKYRIWTEDDITTFHQFVSENRFNCVNVCQSQDPNLPNLVELFLFSPVPTIRDGKMCLQNAPTNVSIGTFLINQGRAQSISLQDQIEALHQLKNTFEKLIRMSSAKSSSKNTSEDETNKSIEDKNKKRNKTSEGPVRIPRPVKLPRPHSNSEKNRMRTSKSVKSKMIVLETNEESPILKAVSVSSSEKLSNLDSSSSIHSETTGISSEGYRVDLNITTSETNSIMKESNLKPDSVTQTVKGDVSNVSVRADNQNLQPDTISQKVKGDVSNVLVRGDNQNLQPDSVTQTVKGDVSNVPVRGDNQDIGVIREHTYEDTSVSENFINSAEVPRELSIMRGDNPLSRKNDQELNDSVCDNSVVNDSDRALSVQTSDMNVVAASKADMLDSISLTDEKELLVALGCENELSETEEVLTVENFLSDMPTVQMQLAELEDKLSNISSESGFVPASNEGSVPDSPSRINGRKIDLKSKAFNVMLSHVRSPGHFYVHVVSSSVGKTLEKMMKNLNLEFEQMSKRHLSRSSKTYKPKVNDMCCARFSSDNLFYRAVITALEPPDSPSKSDLEENVGRVHVFYLDFGDREWVPKRKVFPLPEEYRDTPPLSLSCGMAYIQPANQSPDNREWNEKVTDTFVAMTGFEKTLQMIVVSGGLTINMESSPGCGMIDRSPLKVFLVNCNEGEEVCINLDLIRLGHATLITDCDPNVGLQTPTTTEAELMSSWDPMADDYLSIRNSYDIDVDDAGIASVGYKAQDEKRICKYYVNNSCWRGDRCPYRHVNVTSGGITLDQEPVYAGIEEYHMEALMPEAGTCVGMEIVTVVNPGHFYVILPWGKKPLDALLSQSTDGASEQDEETLQELVSSMQQFYGSTIFSNKTLVHYAEGEIIAARFNQDGKWYRAKVLCSDDHKIQVFYVDFGNREWIVDRNARNMDPQFLHLPFQAIECFMVDIEPKSASGIYDKLSKDRFLQMVDGKTLVGYVKVRSWSGCLWVDLFDTSGCDDVNIAQQLIAEGLAREPQTPSEPASSPLSRSTSEGSLRLIPG